MSNNNNRSSVSNHSTNYPLIDNSQQYMFEQKFVSIHSEDRDITKYPNSAEFDIEMPQEYNNVQGIKLSTWTFPSNNSVFTCRNNNVEMTFKITNPYNPGDDPLLQIIFMALCEYRHNEYAIIIEEGSYTPSQMAMELTNKFNESVSDVIREYIIKNGTETLLTDFNVSEYDHFVVAANTVSNTLWFGNKSAQFEITNDSAIYGLLAQAQPLCGRNKQQHTTEWGLPSYLGFTREPVCAVKALGCANPRFYYGDALVPGDKGYWIKPDINYTYSSVYYLEAPLKMKILGPSYFYMELDGYNYLDEMLPYVNSRFTRESNETNGTINAAFAKISNVSSYTTDWTYNSSDISPIKIFNPPADRIKKLRIKLRYHNGQLVDFNNGDYSFTLEFTIFKPQIQKKFNMYAPETVKYSNS